MRSSRIISLSLLGAFLVTSVSTGQVLQSSGEDGRLWVRRDGARVEIHRPEDDEIRFDLPPGASLRAVEPTAGGWVAAGRLPTGSGSDLLILRGTRQGSDLVAPPGPSGARYRRQPVVLVHDGALSGLAWAEGAGPRELEIWAAPWQDGAWGEPEQVSARGPGSQVAPQGVVLEDGSWILVWAAYDGEDDEILWSRRTSSEWSAPRRVHADNDVPDLMPALIATESSALTVWSWFDGNDYRLKSARWNGSSWLESNAFGGRGSGSADLFRGDGAILLLFQSVDPAAWTVLEMDLEGAPRRMAVVLQETNERPLLVVPEEGDALLRWSVGDRVLEWQDRP